ncbi:MAG: hypothetical protein ACREJN_21600 [Nitrospiraceae bacterium]
MKNVTDKTGRELEEGDIVEVCMVGMFRGQVVKIDPASALVGPQSLPPHIVIQVISTSILAQDGSSELYLIARPDSDKPKLVGLHSVQ